MDDSPQGVLDKILGHVDPECLWTGARGTCRRWKTICSDDELWRGLFERQWASRARMDFLYCEPPPFTPPGGQSWKDAFVEEMVLWDGIDWDAQGRAHDAPTDRSGEGPEYDFLFNIVLIGDSVVPKSSFIMRLCCDSVPSPHTTTIGIDFKVRAVQVRDKVVKLQVWDTAGQERFRTISTAYYRGAHGILLCFALDNRASLDSCIRWHGEIKRHAAETVNVILLGLDNGEGNRQVSLQLGRDTATRLGCRYAEATPPTGSGVHKAGAILLHEIMKTQRRLGLLSPQQSNLPVSARRTCTLM